MVQMVEQHAAFFLTLFGAVWTVLLVLSTLLIRATQKRMGDFELGQVRQDEAIGFLRNELGQYKVKVQDMSNAMDRVEKRTESLHDKFNIMARENTESHATIIEGRTTLIERVATLEAKANGKMESVERHIDDLGKTLLELMKTLVSKQQ